MTTKNEWKVASAEQLQQQARDLSDKLNDLFDGQPIICIAAAMHAILVGDKEIARTLALMSLQHAERAAAECSCPKCTAERKAKRGQA
jgi:hypothetical protein